MSLRSTLQDMSIKIKNLLSIKPFFCYFLSGIDKKVLYEGDKLASHIWCAAVGKTDNFTFSLFINDKGWDRIAKLEQKIGYTLKEDILMHEGLHLAYLHPITLKGCKYPDIMNIAADLEINQSCPNITNYNKGRSLEDNHEKVKAIVESNLSDEEKKEAMIKLQEETDPTFMTLDVFNWSDKKLLGTKVYYEMLLELGQKAEDNKLGPGDSKAGGEMIKDMKNKGDLAKAISDMLGHGEWRKLDEKLDSLDNSILSQKIRNVVKDILERSRRIGDLPGNYAQFLDSLYEEKPPVLDWKRTLRLFAQKSIEYHTKLSSRKINKRNPEFRAVKVKNLCKILYVVDTSGSMSDDDIMEGFQELDNIRKVQRATIDVLECDAQVYPENIRTIDNFKRTIPKSVQGRGGTSVDPAIHWVNKAKGKYSAMIYFTDGYVPVPQVKCSIPMLTIVTAEGLEDVSSLRDSKRFGYVIKTNKVND
jgi:predicted metal-dependent peptidase